jgi:hypothetical protein
LIRVIYEGPYNDVAGLPIPSREIKPEGASRDLSEEDQRLKEEFKKRLDQKIADSEGKLKINSKNKVALQNLSLALVQRDVIDRYCTSCHSTATELNPAFAPHHDIWNGKLLRGFVPNAQGLQPDPNLQKYVVAGSFEESKAKSQFYQDLVAGRMPIGQTLSTEERNKMLELIENWLSLGAPVND